MTDIQAPNQEKIEFTYQGTSKEAYNIEGRIVWLRQTYPTFLDVNKAFYRDNGEHDQAKRDFWLACKPIHFDNAFRAVLTKEGKPYFENQKVKLSSTPCRWEMNMYFKNSDCMPFYANYYDHDTAHTMRHFLSLIINRCNPKSKKRQHYKHQVFKKAIILDRITDEVVFEYPSKGMLLPSFTQIAEELTRVSNNFARTGEFLPHDYYTADAPATPQWQAPPKVVAAPPTQTDPQVLFFKFREQARKALQELGDVEAANDVALLEFVSFKKDTLMLFVQSQAHFEKVDNGNAIYQLRKALLDNFKEVTPEPKLAYALHPKATPPKESIPKQAETAPKQSETEVSDFALKNIDTVFIEFKKELVRYSKSKLEYTELELAKHLVTKKLVVFTLPHQTLIDKFLEGEMFYIKSAFRAKFGGGKFEIHLREDKYFKSELVKM